MHDALHAGAGADADAVVSEAAQEGLIVQLVADGRVLAGTPPAGPAWSTAVDVGAAGSGEQLVAWQPLDRAFLAGVERQMPPHAGTDLTLVSHGRAFTSTTGDRGPAAPVELGEPYDASFGGTGVRTVGVGVAATQGAPVRLFATYPSSQLSSDVRDAQLKILVPLALVCVAIALIAFFAAGRASRSLTDLSDRTRSLLRPGTVPDSGDELVELNAVIDHMTGELSTRVTELRTERDRVKETLKRYGETLAVTHDLDALVGAVLDTAVQATSAQGGRIMLYDADTGVANERARIGAFEPGPDLPPLVTPGTGLEGIALTQLEPRRVILPRAILTAPIARDDMVLGLVTVVDPQDGYFGSDDIETLSGLAVQAAVAIENARLHRVVEQQAVTDDLTGLANRRQFFEVLGRELERANRFEQETALILFDLDDFKRINDTLGHLAGDAVLRAVARTVQAVIREIDVAARYGGEEFIVLLPQTDREGAANLAERLRVAIAEIQIPYAGMTIGGVTASFGVASGPDAGTTQLDLVAIADAALYAAKHRGKNTVA